MRNLNFKHKNVLFLKESFLVSFTEYLLLGTIFFVTVVLNKYYSTSILGDFSFSYSLSQVAVFGICSAFSPLLRKEFTISTENVNTYFNTINQIKLLVLVILLIVTVPFIYLYKPNLLLIIVIFLISRSLDIINETFYIYYQSVNEFKVYALFKCGHSVFLISCISIIAYFHFNVFYIFYSFLFFSILLYSINLLYIKNKKIAVISYSNFYKFNKDKRILIKKAWPLLVNNFIFQINSRLSVFIIFILLGNAVTGVFSSGLMTITFFTAMSAPLGIVLFSDLNKTFEFNKELLQKKVNGILIKLFLLGLIITGVYYITIKYQILVIGALPSYATQMFSIMAFSIPFLITIGGIGNIFVIIDKLKEALVYSFVSLIFSISSYFIFIYFKQTLGLSISFLIISIFNLFFLYTYFLYLIKGLIKEDNK